VVVMQFVPTPAGVPPWATHTCGTRSSQTSPGGRQQACGSSQYGSASTPGPLAQASKAK